MPDPVPELWNAARGTRIASRLDRPRGLLRRWLGLLVRPPLQPGEALWLDPCGGIHTWGLEQEIDVVFLDRGRTVLRVARAVRPWRLVFAPGGTRSAIELPAGGASGVEVGDRLAARGAGEGRDQTNGR